MFLWLFFYPIKNEVLKKQYTNWNELLNYCKINNIKTVDLLDFYVNEVGMNSTNIHNFYWKKDGHHNAKGYEKFAEGIFFSLKKDSIDIFSIHY